ncbi:type IV pilus secretin PilQ [bacterium]|nr:type IV pilus secretin PilQ [bacterium]
MNSTNKKWMLGLFVGVVSLAVAQQNVVNDVVPVENVEVQNSEVEIENKVYDFSFIATDFRAVFKAIGARAGVDILPSPEIEGKLTLSVTKKSWQETLEIICNLHEFSWVVEDKYVHVLPKKKYQERLIKDASKELQFDQLAPKVQRIFYIRNAKADELQSVVRGLLSSGAKTTLIERNNALVVYDNEKRLAKVDSILTALDIETRQVIINARLLYVRADNAQSLGVNWQGQGGYGTAPSGATGDAESVTNPAAPGDLGVYDSRTQVSASNGTDGTKLSLGFLQGNIGLTVQQLLSTGQGEIVSSPQITTLDHSVAEIFVGTQQPIRVVDERGVAGNQIYDAGVRLTVTPHVTGENRVRLEIKTENNDFGIDKTGAVVISTQEASTNVVVNNSETAVIAGLTSNNESEGEVGIPYLMDIPVLGWLFKMKNTTVAKQDLIIFITPTIVEPSKATIEDKMFVK